MAQYLISHIFPTYCKHCYILRLNTVVCCVSKKERKEAIFNINTHFMIRTTYVEIQTSTTIIPQGNVPSDREIKQHI